MITGKTKLLGVIGYPVEHSLSPLMHNAAIQAINNQKNQQNLIDFVYLPFPIKPEDLNTAIAGFSAIGVQGFNITIPHKQAIIPLLSEVSDIAQAVGAVNTVYRTNKGWAGTNTDVTGFLAPLQTYNWDSHQKVAVILGNGGAARAVVAGCAQLGFAEIHVVGRSIEKLAAFEQSWVNSPLPVNIKIHNWDDLPSLIAQADLLVNTTPVGMYPNIQESPVDEAIFERLSPGAIAYDLIYIPNPTKFLQQAQVRGAIAIDGLEMLVQQGAAALELWLQQSVPVDVMRNSLRKHLGLI
ncbi:MAG: shikimate dehydrogenase [Okeania sp. SIO3I5]|uniref:shikimate dehydrogenase n=1 Tax=Okeania sp. SIO3I5 TaxID=2607805 RepID=UPI0013B7E996|nr:shikimate dehydrogenase [Okeania sp. SIO3I5]NEQ40857.1 shikimate dehydrogenase [Okeania sp. SIO3I5]